MHHPQNRGGAYDTTQKGDETCFTPFFMLLLKVYFSPNTFVTNSAASFNKIAE